MNDLKSFLLFTGLVIFLIRLLTSRFVNIPDWLANSLLITSIVLMLIAIPMLIHANIGNKYQAVVNFFSKLN